MKKNLIENDIKKMQSLISHRVGMSINEQNEQESGCPGNLVKVDTQCCLPTNKKIERGAPRIGKLRKDSKSGRYRIKAWGEFPSGVDKNPTLIKEFINALQSEIDASPEIDTEKFNVNIAVAKISSSASNDMGGPVKANHSNSNHIKDSGGGHSHTESEDFFTGNQTSNETLAANRGVNLWAGMKKSLSGKNSKIKIIMDPTVNNGEPVFKSWVTDTGGCIDSRRDISKYKNPGQIVTIRATLELVDKAAEEERRCLTGMKVIVGYYCPSSAFDKTIEDKKALLDNNELTQEEYEAEVEAIEIERKRSLKINKGRVSISSTTKKPGGHSCNRAQFAIYMNDVKIGPKGPLGVVNLNNAGGSSDPGNPINGINIGGGSREGSVVVSPRQALLVSNKKVEAGEPGSVIIQIQGLTKSSHNDVPWIQIITGQGKVLMDKQADKVKGYNAARGKTKRQKLFGPFNPCELIS